MQNFLNFRRTYEMIMHVTWILVFCLLSPKVMMVQLPKEECDSLDPIPGYNLGGEGFDIVKMETKTSNVIDMNKFLNNDQCRAFRNTEIDGRPLQKVPTAVAEWKLRHQCSFVISTKSYSSVVGYQSEVGNSVSESWRLGLEPTVGLITGPEVSVPVSVAGSESKLSKFATSESKKSDSFFQKLQMDCIKYEYKLNAGNLPLTDNFMHIVNMLPNSSSSANDKTAYTSFIQEFGTHYMNQVTLGGSITQLTAMQKCKVRSFGFSLEQAEQCMSLEAAVALKAPVPGTVVEVGGSAEAAYETCTEKLRAADSCGSFSSTFHQREWKSIGGDARDVVGVFFDSSAGPEKYQTWVDGLKTRPDVIEYELKPLYILLQAIPGASLKSNALLEATKEYYSQAVAKFKSEVSPQSCRFKCPFSTPESACTCTCTADAYTDENCCPLKRGYGKLKITIIRGIDIQGDTFDSADSFVKITGLSVAKQTRVVAQNSNPDWSQTFDMGVQLAGQEFGLNLIEKDDGSIDFLPLDLGSGGDDYGTCYVRVEPSDGTEQSCEYNDKGTVYYSMDFRCQQYFTGDLCDNFEATRVKKRSVNGCDGAEKSSERKSTARTSAAKTSAARSNGLSYQLVLGVLPPIQILAIMLVSLRN